MEQIPILFHQTLEDLRRIGARGGRAHGRTCRARQRAGMQVEAVAMPPVVLREETTAEAIATLDTIFPWLQGAELRPGRHLSAMRAPESAGQP